MQRHAGEFKQSQAADKRLSTWQTESGALKNCLRHRALFAALRKTFVLTFNF